MADPHQETRRLLDRRATLLRERIHHIDPTAARRDCLLDTGDAAAAAAAETEQLALRDRARDALHDVQAALHRLDTGDYGRCVYCGRPISADRLDAVPTADTCTECADPATNRSTDTEDT
ncbi:TraR/DksA family transcriptional regulator [Stackebrandtia albiflava]|uniref:TraR/DksA family transcriptional regulator n=1 Tax=Stackebrandtia albiflava TaxID=406432 RepID=A0A562VDK9_9ACTN|nr:TraR/DksA C4-type zinc finger protein [Stackebrandtia albiflava]TWJ15969.1 TraR/DksA family transcriptional regulator [Stackebrandtia albiflava]